MFYNPELMAANARTSLLGKDKAAAPINQIDAVESRWFAVYTHYKREKLVRDRLNSQGVENFLPLLHYTRHYRRKVREVQLPLIHHYIFVRVTQSEYTKVLRTPGVISFLRIGRDLLSIPETEIHILQRVIGQKRELIAEPSRLCPGQPMEVIAGQLTGLRGKFIEALNPNNFVIELEQLGMDLRMQIDPALLQAIK